MLRSVTHRELALADPLYFMGYYMGQRCLPHRAKFLDFFMSAYTHKLLLAPREHWKTTTLIGYMIWRLLNNPNLRILVVSNTMKLSTDIVTNIRDLLGKHPKITRDFGSHESKDWGKESFTVRNRTDLTVKEPSCMAAGLGTGILGYHFDIVWCDDIVKEENQWTKEQREKVMVWFEGTLLRCCDHEMIITGTRKNVEDLYQILMDRGGYEYKVHKAIINEEQQEVLAPEIFSYDRLQDVRVRMGSLMFAQEMQNEPVALEGLALKRDWLQYYDLSNPPNFNWIYAGVDPAVGKSDISSYTALVLVGVTPSHQFYVLDMQRHRWPVDWEHQCAAILNTYVERGFKLDLVAVESIITFKYVTAPLINVSPLPIRFVDYKQAGDTQIKDKVARIQSLGVYFEQGRVFLPNPDQYPMTVQFAREEYLIFPQGEYTDLLDALNLAISAHASMPSGEAAFRIG